MEHTIITTSTPRAERERLIKEHNRTFLDRCLEKSTRAPLVRDKNWDEAVWAIRDYMRECQSNRVPYGALKSAKAAEAKNKYETWCRFRCGEEFVKQKEAI